MNLLISLLAIALVVSFMYALYAQSNSERYYNISNQVTLSYQKAQKDADMERERLKELVQQLNEENLLLKARLKECDK
jgi:hypothetical protein